MRVLIAASEAIPYCKTGGLADVSGSLFKELATMNIDVRLIIPLYKGIMNNFPVSDTGVRLVIPMQHRNYQAHLYSDNGVFFVRCDEFFDRDWLYGETEGDFPDNALRFAFFCRTVLEACRLTDYCPDIIHFNDWQTSLIPLYIKTHYQNDKFFRNVVTVLTIHNIGYQGLFKPEIMPLIDIERGLFSPESIEFYGKVNFLKAGILYADIITTVSRRYAEEIITSEYGFGLDGVLKTRKKDIYGIRNGVDYTKWSPSVDTFIAKSYSSNDMRDKAYCKKKLLKDCGFVIKKNIPLISFIGRFASQKGIKLIISTLSRMIEYGCRVVMLGKGDRNLENILIKKASGLTGKLYLKKGFDEKFAHSVYAGSDMVIIPSQYEPCGLVQMIAMKYGTVPVVRRTGGLSDTIEDYNALSDTGTGFLFDSYNASAFFEAIKRAVTVYTHKNRWNKLMQRGMNKDFSWKKSAAEYIELYKKTLSS